MIQFLESPRFNTEIRYGVVGGPEFSTDVVTVTSGAEQRNSNWLDSRGKWQCAQDLYNKHETDSLIAFFRNRKGRAGSFRFKDWSDWNCVNVATTVGGVTTLTYQGFASALPLAPVPSSGIVPAILGIQMTKAYTVGTQTVYRTISKPVQGTIRVYQGGVLITPTIDYTKGIILGLTSPTGVTWDGEFDVPARFDVDTFNATFEGYRDSDGESVFSITGLTIVEVRLA